MECHSADTKKGELDLSRLINDADVAEHQALWIKVHDRTAAGEMPPAEFEQPSAAARQTFTRDLTSQLIKLDNDRAAKEGRAVRRRLNRYEYENTLRDLLDAPWLQIKTMLPEDGEAYRFNKVGEALDVSHVQIARYMAAADYALREVIAHKTEAPAPMKRTFYARECGAFSRKVKYSEFNRSPERATFPILGFEADIDALEEKVPMAAGAKNPERRELEAMGVVASSYEPIELRFDAFKAPASGRYKIRVHAYSFWAGPESADKWYRPSRTDISKGRTREPVSLYSETPPRLLRKLGTFEVTPEPAGYEMEVILLKGESIRPDAVRLFRSRPPGPWRNPLAEKDRQPGVAFQRLDVEGPIIDQWPSAGHRLLFDDLPLVTVGGQATIKSDDPEADAARLLRRFMQRALRQPFAEEDVERFMKIVRHALRSESSFEDAMIAAYSGVLCSPAFVTTAEKAGELDDAALAARLSYFLWNSEPDAKLRADAHSGSLHEASHLKSAAERLLDDEKSDRFVQAFLDYWLDLRKTDATSPDAALYPDYYLDDYLVECAGDETRAFFRELMRRNLPASNLIDSDFVIINERLALHYEIPGVTGVALRKVDLPPDSVRGGLLTQASILKVTANGTTTSPVVRGVWMTERILGKPIPPPPAAVPAVEPDIRGAVTIREQLDKHRSLESCNACHARIDPPGYALENFDVLGGYRKAYRKTTDEIGNENKKRLNARGYGKNGQPFEFADGPSVDASGELPSGGRFADIEGLKALLLKDERQVARNLVHQLVVYATGAPVRFGDRPEVEAVLDQAATSNYGVRDLILALVQSPLFRNK
ncbi:MAG: DUF1592 domain-containing protein [Pirellulales bacterium]